MQAQADDDLTRANYTAANHRADADLAFEYQSAIKTATLAYETKVAQYDQWIAQRELNAGLERSKKLAEAAETRDKALAAANQKYAKTLAARAKERDIAIEEAEADLWKDSEALKLPAVDAWSTSQQTPWAAYQKKLVQNAIDYVNGLAPKLVEQFTKDAGSIETEAKTVIDAQKKLADEAATLRRARTVSDAVSLHTYQSAASVADRDRIIATKQHENSIDPEIMDIALGTTISRPVQHLYTAKNLFEETAYINEDRRYFTLMHTTFAANYRAGIDPMAGYMTMGYEHSRNLATISRDVSVKQLETSRAYDLMQLARQRAATESAANADAAQLTTKTTAYEVYQKEVASHAETFAKDYVRKYGEFVTTTSAAAKTADGAIAGHLTSLVNSDAQLQGEWAEDDLAAENTFNEEVAGDQLEKVQAWDATLNTAWSALQVALAGLEVDRVVDVGGELAEHLGAAAGVVIGAVSDAASQDEALTTDVSSGLDGEAQDLVEALTGYVDKDAAARLKYQRELATKTATHDRSEIARNAAYIKKLAENQRTAWLSEQDATRKQQRTYANSSRTLSITDTNLNEQYGNGSITSSEKQTQLTAAFNLHNTTVANSLTLASLERLQAAHTKLSADAQAKLSWVTDTGNLHVGLAGDVKGLADTLATDLKAATDGLSEDQAAAAEELAGALADAQKEYVSDSAQSQASDDSELAEIDGELEVGLAEIERDQQVGQAEAQGGYETNLATGHSTKLASASIWNGPIGDWKNYALGSAQDKAIWTAGAAEANVAHKLASNNAYVNHTTREHGENGSLLQKLSELGQAAAGQAGASASAAAKLSKETTENLGELAKKLTKASTQAVASSIAAETKYDLVRAEAKRDYNVKVAQAELTRINRKNAAELEYLEARIDWLAAHPGQGESGWLNSSEGITCVGNRDDEFAAALAEELQKLLDAKIEHAAQTLDGQIELANKLGDALSQAATDAGNAAKGFAQDQADTNNGHEQDTTAHEITAVSSRSGAERDYNIRSAGSRQTLIDDLGAADEQLSRDLKVVNVALAEAMAAKAADIHIAALSRLVTRHTTFVVGYAADSQQAFDAAQAVAELGWATAMKPAYVTYAGAMATAAADELVALAVGIRVANNGRATADTVHTTAVEPLNYQHAVDSAIAYRDYAEQEAARRGVRSIAEADANLLLATKYARAAKDRAVAESTADKAYWTSLYALPAGGDSSGIAKARDLAYADGDIIRTTTERYADVAWTTGWAAADRIQRQGQASSEYDLYVEQSRLDRDRILATTPHIQNRLTLQAQAQAAYWTAEVNAANARRTAETVALASYFDTDYAQLVTAIAGIDTALQLPWTVYQVGLAEAKQDWWTESERANLLAATTTINTADSLYQSTINVEYMTWAMALAAAERTFVEATASRSHTRNVVEALAETAYAQTLAELDEEWQIRRATAKRNLDTILSANRRSRIDNGDTAAETAANLLAEAINTTDLSTADLDYTRDESFAAGARSISIVREKRAFTSDHDSALLAYIDATSTANLDFATAEAAANAVRVVAAAEAQADQINATAISLTNAIEDLATTNLSPWSIYDADLQKALANRTSVVGTADENFTIAQVLADRDFTIAELTAAHLADLSVQIATVIYRLAVIDAELESQLAQVATEHDAVENLSILTVAELSHGFLTFASATTKPYKNFDRPTSLPSAVVLPMAPLTIGPAQSGLAPDSAAAISLSLPSQVVSPLDSFFSRSLISGGIGSHLPTNEEALHSAKFKYAVPAVVFVMATDEEGDRILHGEPFIFDSIDRLSINPKTKELDTKSVRIPLYYKDEDKDPIHVGDWDTESGYVVRTIDGKRYYSTPVAIDQAVASWFTPDSAKKWDDWFKENHNEIAATAYSNGQLRIDLGLDPTDQHDKRRDAAATITTLSEVDLLFYSIALGLAQPQTAVEVAAVGSGIARSKSIQTSSLREWDAARRAGAAAKAGNRFFSAAVKGSRGEAVAAQILRNQGRFQEIIPLKNASGHGIDFFAKTADGKWIVFEVKTSETARRGALSAAQKLGANSYAQQQLSRIALRQKNFANASAETVAAARQILGEIGTNHVEGHVIHITNFGRPTQGVSITPWVP